MDSWSGLSITKPDVTNLWSGLNIIMHNSIDLMLDLTL